VRLPIGSGVTEAGGTPSPQGMTRMLAITDGTSNTILHAEKYARCTNTTMPPAFRDGCTAWAYSTALVSPWQPPPMDLGGLGGEAQVPGGRRLGHDHDVLTRVAGRAEGASEALDVGLGVGQVAQLVGVVLADADEQRDLLAGGPAGGAVAPGRGERGQER
jgi:hypothetical protein